MKWLDISAGWGDRLLAAMTLGMKYQGFDPNIDLQPRHDQMIKQFGSTKNHKIIYEPFEKQELRESYYDVVLSSPPFFDLEVYAGDQQSSTLYPELIMWIEKFLFVSLDKVCSALRPGGFLIIYIMDSASGDENASGIQIVNPMMSFMKDKHPEMIYEGVIGVGPFPRPAWVWKKPEFDTSLLESKIREISFV